MEDNLKDKAINGAFWTAIQKFGISIISFLSNIVLARLLTPDDFGCIGMLIIFIVISNSLINGGFVSALIQRKKVSPIDLSTVFYWNFVISIFIYIILYVSAPYIADFYRLDRICLVLRVLGIVLITNGLSAVQTTILRRNMNFSKLAKVNVLSTSIAVILAIILAFLGFNVWALVAQQLLMSFMNFVFLWSSSNWKPQFKFSFISLKEMFSYGSYLMFAELANSICDNIQGLIIGRRFSSVTMGYYTQAKKLEEVPTQSLTQLVTQVTFPLYSIIQDEKERLLSVSKRVMGVLNCINIPMMALLIILAKPLFVLIFSEKWLFSVPYFQILCVGGMVNCMQSVNYQVVAATGHSKKLFYWNFVKRACGIAFMLVGLVWGVKGLLWGMVLGMYFTYYVNASLAFACTGYSVFNQIKDAIPLFLITLFSSFVAYYEESLIDSNILKLLIQTSSFLCIFIFLSLLFKRSEFFELCKISKFYLSKIFYRLL